jgi:large subunit ribosomal protein L31e
MEKIFTIPLRRDFLKAPKWKRTNRSVRTVKDFLKRHMKVEEVKLNAELNEALWEKGSKNPPSKIKVHSTVEEGVAWANLIEHKITIPEKEDKEKKKEKKKEKEEEVEVESEANISRGEPERKKSKKGKKTVKG